MPLGEGRGGGGWVGGGWLSCMCTLTAGVPASHTAISQPVHDAEAIDKVKVGGGGMLGRGEGGWRGPATD